MSCTAVLNMGPILSSYAALALTYTHRPLCWLTRWNQCCGSAEEYFYLSIFLAASNLALHCHNNRLHTENTFHLRILKCFKVNLMLHKCVMFYWHMPTLIRKLLLYNINLLYASLVCVIIQMICYRPDRLCYCIEGWRLFIVKSFIISSMSFKKNIRIKKRGRETLCV